MEFYAIEKMEIMGDLLEELASLTEVMAVMDEFGLTEQEAIDFIADMATNPWG